MIDQMIKELAEDLAVEESYRGTCPLCQGGRTKEKSLVIKKISPYSFFYKCYRATCDLAGGVVDQDVTKVTDRPRQKRKPRKLCPFPEWLDVSEIPLLIAERLQKKYYLPFTQQEKHRLGYCKQKEWLLIPLYGFHGLKHATLSKALTPKDEFKNIYWREDDYPNIHVPIMNPSPQDAKRTVYVVEDAISAIRVAEAGKPAIALLSSEMNKYHMQLLCPRFDRVKFLLDPDIWDGDETPVEAALRRWGALMRIEGAFLPRDPKDIHPQTLKEYLE